MSTEVFLFQSVQTVITHMPFNHFLFNIKVITVEGLYFQWPLYIGHHQSKT